MGGSEFFHIESGKTARIAFKKAVKKALYDHGHNGYTGTIAEKEDFIMIPLPNLKYDDVEEMAVSYAETLMQERDNRVSDKYGPACCIKILHDKFLFFGIAQS